jgi:hypothetical protein
MATEDEGPIRWYHYLGVAVMATIGLGGALAYLYFLPRLGAFMR